VIKAMEDYAMNNNDGKLALDIAKSPLTSETSVHAQEMRTLAERNPESAVSKIRELQKSRQNSIEKRSKKSVSTLKKEGVDEIRKEIKKHIPKTKESWSDFIKSIECGY
jgi:hypothetical protein